MDDERAGAGSGRPSACPRSRRSRNAASDAPRSRTSPRSLDAAARFLEARPRSVREVRRKLTSMGYRAELVDEVVGPADGPPATSTTRPSRGPGSSRGTGRGPAASTRCAASCSSRAWTGRSSTRCSTERRDAARHERRDCRRRQRAGPGRGRGRAPAAQEAAGDPPRAGPATAAPAGLRAARPQRVRAGRVRAVSRRASLERPRRRAPDLPGVDDCRRSGHEIDTRAACRQPDRVLRSRLRSQPDADRWPRSGRAATPVGSRRSPTEARPVPEPKRMPVARSPSPNLVSTPGAFIPPDGRN